MIPCGVLRLSTVGALVGALLLSVATTTVDSASISRKVLSRLCSHRINGACCDNGGCDGPDGSTFIGVQINATPPNAGRWYCYSNGRCYDSLQSADSDGSAPSIPVRNPCLESINDICCDNGGCDGPDGSTFTGIRIIVGGPNPGRWYCYSNGRCYDSLQSGNSDGSAPSIPANAPPARPPAPPRCANFGNGVCCDNGGCDGPDGSTFTEIQVNVGGENPGKWFCYSNGRCYDSLQTADSDGSAPSIPARNPPPMPSGIVADNLMPELPCPEPQTKFSLDDDLGRLF